jgi:hypothetical protein
MGTTWGRGLGWGPWRGWCTGTVWQWRLGGGPCRGWCSGAGRWLGEGPGRRQGRPVGRGRGFWAVWCRPPDQAPTSTECPRVHGDRVAVGGSTFECGGGGGARWPCHAWGVRRTHGSRASGNASGKTPAGTSCTSSCAGRGPARGALGVNGPRNQWSRDDDAEKHHQGPQPRGAGAGRPPAPRPDRLASRADDLDADVRGDGCPYVLRSPPRQAAGGRRCVFGLAGSRGWAGGWGGDSRAGRGAGRAGTCRGTCPSSGAAGCPQRGPLGEGLCPGFGGEPGCRCPPGLPPLSALGRCGPCGHSGCFTGSQACRGGGCLPGRRRCFPRDDFPHVPPVARRGGSRGAVVRGLPAGGGRFWAVRPEPHLRPGAVVVVKPPTRGRVPVCAPAVGPCTVAEDRRADATTRRSGSGLSSPFRFCLP